MIILGTSLLSGIGEWPLEHCTSKPRGEVASELAPAVLKRRAEQVRRGPEYEADRRSSLAALHVTTVLDWPV